MQTLANYRPHTVCEQGGLDEIVAGLRGILGRLGESRIDIGEMAESQPNEIRSTPRHIYGASIINIEKYETPSGVSPTS